MPEMTTPVEQSSHEPRGYRYPNGSSLSIPDRATILALDSLGVSKTAIAKEVGVSRTTVLGTIQAGDQSNPTIVERVKKEMAGHFWVTGHRALAGVTDEKIKAASAFQLTTMAAISTDKALLLEGKPTARVEMIHSDDEAAKEIERLQRDLEAVDVDVVGEEGGTTPDTSTV